MTRLLVGALAVVCLLGGTPGRAGAAANGLLTFVRDDGGGHAQIWIANADGTSEVQVTSDAAPHYDPRWSPDGTKIAFTSYPNPSNLADADIYVIPVSPSGPTGPAVQLTTSSGSDANAAWSPDGTKIAWSSGCNIWTMASDGSSQTQLTRATTSGSCDVEPAWSPDGGQIAYGHHVSAGDYDILATTVDGATTRTVVSTGAFESNPAWSPDGTTIAYDHATSASSGDDDIYTVAAAGGSPGALVATSAFETAPRWLPDGSELVYSSGSDVAVVAASGGTSSIIEHGAFNPEPDWQAVTSSGPGPSPLGSVTVTRTDDPAGAGSCPSDCSLRQALAALSSGGTITLPAGTYTLTQGELLVSQPVAIVGAGASSTTIRQTATARVLESQATLSLSDVTITGGHAASTDCSGGGLLLAQGITVTLARVVVSGNTADCYGGGIEDNATLTVVDSTISSNTAALAGGGLHYVVAGPLAMANTIVAANSASQGGGIDAGNSGQPLSFVNDTIVGNSGPSRGGGIDAVGPAITMRNTIVSGSTGVNCADLGNSIVSAGHNISSDATCGFTSAGDHLSTDPQLDGSYAPQSGGPAYDGGDDSDCPSPDVYGTSRPQGAHCDVGAVEGAGSVATPPPATTTTTPEPAPGGSPQSPPVPPVVVHVDLAPVAAITRAARGLVVRFDGRGSVDPDGRVVAYAWSFGDGTRGRDALVLHRYARAGRYLVTLTVTDDAGASDSARLLVVVAPATVSVDVTQVVAVGDGASLVPPAAISLGEGIDVGDLSAVIPAADVADGEGIGVGDLSAVIPAADVAVAEAVAAAVASIVTRPAVIDVHEGIGVGGAVSNSHQSSKGGHR